MKDTGMKDAETTAGETAGTGFLSRLDGHISLSQELNLPSAEGEAAGRAGAGKLSAGRRPRDTAEMPEEALARAVIEQAAEDWRRAVGKLRRRPDHPEAAAVKRETERFFRSRWFRVLVDLDGNAFLARLRRKEAADRGPGFPPAGDEPR